MKISADWLPKGPNTAPEEATTVARISIKIDGRSATDLRESRQNSIVSYVVAPAYPLAESVAFRWWVLVHGRGRTTNLRTMRAGFAFPSISIKGTGNGTTEIRCEPYDYENPPIEFITRVSEVIPTREFEKDTKFFIEHVLGRLREEGVGDTPLSTRWARVSETTNNPEERVFYKAAGALGVDPYTCGDDVAAFIEAAASKFESDDLEEFLAAMEPQTVTTAIDWLKEVEHKPGRWSVLPAIEDCRQAVRFRRAPTKPWTIGYASARKVRKQLQFSDYQPVGELSALGKRLGNPLFHATEKSPAGLRAVSYVPRGNPQAIVGGGRRPEAVLFATTRTVGDAIHFGAPRYSPVTDQQGTYRQMLGRAFAAEFLAPVKEVLEMRERGEAVEDIAAHFGVGEMVISHQIENAPNSLEA